MSGMAEVFPCFILYITVIYLLLYINQTGHKEQGDDRIA